MKIRAWRIVKAKHAATALSGEGAARSGGRWNSRGVQVVYASSTKALAALENLVHLNPPVLFKYVVFGLEFDETLVEKIARDRLPSSWSTEPPARSTQVIGDQWVTEACSAVLEVPSAIVPDESNFLLNPAHPEFGTIVVGQPEPFAFDRRLL